MKSMENQRSSEDRIKFLQEAAIMGQFDHPYIIKIHGIMATEDKVCMINYGYLLFILMIVFCAYTVPYHCGIDGKWQLTG